ncbi:MAG: response regulator [Elusimicrobia bacterium]|nr:response regulator [Elusimicrobiota bacterium]
MENLHSLLSRQLKKHYRALPTDEFLLAVDAAYRQADEERALLERSLELTSQEMLRDLDELRRAKEALWESQSFLEKAQEAANIGSWAVGFDGGRVKLSKECFRILGLDAGAEPTFERFADMVHPDDRAPYLRARESAIRGVSAYEIEYRIVRPDGSVRRVRSRADVVRDKAGAAIKLIGILQDVTERHELEERLRQSQKMEAVGRLAGGIAHDFNNILTAMKGYCSFLKGAVPKDGVLFRDVEEIEKSADRAATLTHQLLAFSRKQVLKPEVVDVNHVIGGLEGMMRCLIREDIDVVTRLKPGVGRIKADPGQIAQVLMNLIINARDAMPNGGRLVIETDDVAADASPLGVPAVMLEVTDGGSGMDPEVLAHAFEPFFTTKAVGKGTGLGLATVYGIVSQSGGHIAVASSPGRGTRFTIQFPAFAPGGMPDAPDVPAVSEGGKASETVLVVEDEDGVRKMICRSLLDQGYRVEAAADGEEALRLLEARSGPIDLVLTDIIMPGMNGRALAERIAARAPETRILYMSGYPDDVIARHGVLEPGTPFLQKPFTPRLLVETLREVLRRVAA